MDFFGVLEACFLGGVGVHGMGGDGVHGGDSFSVKLIFSWSDLVGCDSVDIEGRIIWSLLDSLLFWVNSCLEEASDFNGDTLSKSFLKPFYKYKMKKK